jgi:hypothetical protein
MSASVSKRVGIVRYLSLNRIQVKKVIGRTVSRNNCSRYLFKPTSIDLTLSDAQ